MLTSCWGSTQGNPDVILLWHCVWQHSANANIGTPVLAHALQATGGLHLLTHLCWSAASHRTRSLKVEPSDTSLPMEDSSTPLLRCFVSCNEPAAEPAMAILQQMTGVSTLHEVT